MFMLELLALLVLIAASNAAPLANVRVRVEAGPDVYEYDLSTDGANTLSQNSLLSIGRRSARQYGQRLARVITPENAEALSPVGVFVAPIDVNDLGYSSEESRGRHVTPDFSNGLEYPDPLLLEGAAAMRAIRYLYGRGELFHADIPHVRAILMNQEERRRNGLSGNLLGSLNPSSPFYRKGNANE